MPNLLPATERVSALLSLPRSDEGKVAGVCATLADHWDIDPMLVRVAALLLSVSGGIGVVLYAAGWLWMPPSSGGQPIITRVLPGAEAWSATRISVVLALASIASLLATSSLLPFGPGPFLVLLAVVFIARRASARQAESPTTVAPALQRPADLEPTLDPSSEFAQAVTAWQQRLQTIATTEGPGPTTPLHAAITARAAEGHPPAAQQSALPAHAFQAPARPEPSPPAFPLPRSRPACIGTEVAAPSRRRRVARRRTSGWVTVATLALAALAWLVTDQVFAQPPTVLLAASSLAVIAVALIATSWRGRPRFLMFPALVLAVVVAQGLSPVGLNQPLEQHTWTTAADVPADIVLEGNSIEVDAHSLTLSKSTDLHLSVTGGVATIDLPDDLPWTVTYRIKGGVLGTKGDQGSAGWTEGEFSGGGEGTHRLHLDVTILGGVVMLE